jgi:peptidylprolyl isomerase
MATNQKPQVEVPSDQPPSYQLEIEDIAVGDGEEAVAGRVVEVHYVGVSWSTGKQFDASWDRGSTFKFGLGKRQVIPGWDQGVEGMRVGGRRPPDDPAAARLRQARRGRRHRARRDARLRRGPGRRALI